jgi:hypothetical protein
METKGTYTVKGQHGGRRIAGEGKKIGRPAEELGTNPTSYLNILDDETIEILEEMVKAKIVKSRSEAIRRVVKSYKI